MTRGRGRGKNPTPTGLWRHGDFLMLWAGQTVSVVGSEIGGLVLPLVAALTLGASAEQMGLLRAIENVPWLLAGLAAGVWVDRMRRRPILIAADLGRAVVLGSIPVAALLGALHLAQLYVVGFLAGLLTVFFQVAYRAYLPALIGRERLMEGNGKLEISRSVAQIGGPGLAGLLVQLVTAPLAIAADALSLYIKLRLSPLNGGTRRTVQPPDGGRGRKGYALLAARPFEKD